MKKKLLALVLAAAMTLSLAACGGSKTETPADNSGDTAADTETPAEGASYTVGICSWCSILHWTPLPRALWTL